MGNTFFYHPGYVFCAQIILKYFAYILSFAFLTAIFFNNSYNTVSVSNKKNKTERLEKLQIASSQVTNSAIDFKLTLPFSFEYKFQGLVRQFSNGLMKQINFIDLYLKTLLIYIISPNAP